MDGMYKMYKTIGILDIVSNNLFEKLKKDALTVKRIRLEREEKLKIAEVEKLSQQIKLLHDNSNNVTQCEHWVLEGKIRELDNKIKMDNMHLEMINHQIRVVNNLVGWRSGIK
jgi:hypothetical protein